MAVDMNAFKGFVGQIKGLADMAMETTYTPEERVQRAKAVFAEKMDAPKAVDLESCVHCGLCAEACHYYVTSGDPKFTPTRKLDLLKRFYRREKSPFRWIYRMTTPDITAQDLEDWQELVYDSCTECGRCGIVCPMGIDIASGVNVMRQGLAEAGLIPAELRAVMQEQGARGTVFGAGADMLRSIIEELRAEGLEVPLDKEKADILVLTSTLDIQLYKDVLRSTIKVMNHIGADWTIHTCAFEGANFGLLSGYEQVQKQASERITNEAIRCGASTVIVPECGHAYPAMRWEGANEHGAPLPFDVLAVSEFLGREVTNGNLRIKPMAAGTVFTYHDPCKVGRHGGVLEEPRVVLKALGVDLHETDSHGKMNYCCGGGAGVFLINRASELRQNVFELKRQQVDETGAEALVTSCGSCRINFMNGAVNAGWQTPIHSLMELVGNNLA
jgi:Fe-S oxidoreductase